MSKTVDAGIVTAYGAAVRGGYEGTYAQFCADLGKLADVLSEFMNFDVTVQTLAEGASATASYNDGVLALGIPRGNTGNGIQSIMLNADYTLTVTYTNGNTWTSGSIRGQVGATPHLTIGTVQTLEPGQSATAEITGTDEDPVLNLGIPKGQAGASDAGGISYDPESSYNEGTVGAELQEQNRQLSDLDTNFENATDEYEVSIDYGALIPDSWYANNGTEQSKAGYSRTDKIDISKYIAVVVNKNIPNYRCHFWDANNTRINKVFTLTADVPYPIPANAKYLGVCEETATITGLTVSGVYQGAFYELNGDVVHKEQGTVNANSQLIVDNYGIITPHKFFTATPGIATNLVDINNVFVGVDLNGNARSNYASTDFIPVVSGAKYCISSNVSILEQVYYDKYKNFYSNGSLSTTGQTLPDDVRYVRLCFYYNDNTIPRFGVFAGLDSFTYSTPYGFIPPYVSADTEFETYLRLHSQMCDKTPVLRSSGRYSGVNALSKGDRLVHPTNYSLEIHASGEGDKWFERGVTQFYSATMIAFTNSSVTPYLNPADYGAEVGDVIYIGFLARSTDGVPKTSQFTSQALEYLDQTERRVYFDDNIRLYEFTHTITQENYSSSFQFYLSANIEFSNLYICLESNKEFEHLFIDPLWHEVEKYYISNNLNTKTLVAFGDSVTAFGFYLNSLKKRLPLGTLINEGIGGSCFCYTDTSRSSNFYNIVETKRADIESADIITVSYGTNDSNYIGTTTTIGEIAAVGSTFDLLTTYGAIQSGLEKIISYNPSARIIMIIPATWIVFEYAKPIAKAIIDCAELYGCMVVDFRKCGCNELTQARMTTDGLHPTSAVGELCGKLLVNAMAPIYML